MSPPEQLHAPRSYNLQIFQSLTLPLTHDRWISMMFIESSTFQCHCHAYSTLPFFSSELISLFPKSNTMTQWLERNLRRSNEERLFGLLGLLGLLWVLGVLDVSRSLFMQEDCVAVWQRLLAHADSITWPCNHPSSTFTWTFWTATPFITEAASDLFN